MRVVHVCVAGTQPLLSRDGGAIQRRIMELGKAQAALGHDVLAISAGPADHESIIEGVRVRIIRCLAPMPWRHVEYLARVSTLVGRSHPDVLNFHGQPEGSLLARLRDLPSALLYDNFVFSASRYPGTHGLYRRLFAAFDLLLPCSVYCQQESASYWDLDASAMRVQYNGVNLAQFRPDPDGGAQEKERLGIEGLVALYVGRVNPQKGTDLLLRSWAEVRSGVPNATLVIAGPIGQFGTPARAATEAAWRSRIEEVGGRYLGSVDEGRLATTYNIADVFVMPTRAFEMFGMAAVEAQACGIPTVASDHGGLRETVPRGCGGRFAAGDAGALAEELIRVLSDADLRRMQSRAAVENAARFSWERVTQDLEQAYRGVGIHG